ncbi:MAG: 4Fe-4S dicluster domain-containing protein, partial [Thermodesulfobacteriota bacterium]
FHVDLVEKGSHLGGNLTWLAHTIDGKDVPGRLEEAVSQVTSHSLITVHLNAEVTESTGALGRFQSSIQSGDGEGEAIHTVTHGAAILATGGVEAETESYGCGQSAAVMTHKAFETARTQGNLDPKALSAVAMIQCVDCREPPRNYCSRICCQSALKHALYLKEKNPDIAVYILYRDMMAQGFAETYYTQARRQGIVFIPYSPETKPDVILPENEGADSPAVRIQTRDPILGQPVEIDADLLLLATGVKPVLPGALMERLGAETDAYGFFKEADFKWRPVDSLAAGVFACGLALSPRAIDESIASAEAAAMRAVRLISRPQIKAGRRVAVVRHSLCSRCQLCMTVCPFDARAIDPDTGDITVQALKCQGCGACAAVCPNSATILSEGSDMEMFEKIDAALGF